MPDGDIGAILEAQLSDTPALLDRVPPHRLDYRYESGKWSTREVLGHVNDIERLFAFRAFWFSRGFDSPLPSFDQHTAVLHGGTGAVYLGERLRARRVGSDAAARDDGECRRREPGQAR